MAQAIVDVTEQQRLNLAREAGIPWKNRTAANVGRSECCSMNPTFNKIEELTESTP